VAPTLLPASLQGAVVLTDGISFHYFEDDRRKDARTPEKPINATSRLSLSNAAVGGSNL